MIHMVKYAIVQGYDISIIYEVIEITTNLLIFIFLYFTCYLVLNYVRPRMQNVLQIEECIIHCWKKNCLWH